MTEKGFFHPDRGYWQTTDEPPQRIISAYPQGTVEVPLRPSEHHQWTGKKWVKVLPELAEKQAVQREAYRQAVQAYVDATAQSRDYGDGASLASYSTSQHAPWRAEAGVFVAWRDVVWLMVFDILDQVQAGDIPPPQSAEALIDLLPPIEWPVEHVS